MRSTVKSENHTKVIATYAGRRSYLEVISKLLLTRYSGLLCPAIYRDPAQCFVVN